MSCSCCLIDMCSFFIADDGPWKKEAECRSGPWDWRTCRVQRLQGSHWWNSLMDTGGTRYLAAFPVLYILHRLFHVSTVHICILFTSIVGHTLHPSLITPLQPSSHTWSFQADVWSLGKVAEFVETSRLGLRILRQANRWKAVPKKLGIFAFRHIFFMFFRHRPVQTPSRYSTAYSRLWRPLGSAIPGIPGEPSRFAPWNAEMPGGLWIRQLAEKKVLTSEWIEQDGFRRVILKEFWWLMIDPFYDPFWAFEFCESMTGTGHQTCCSNVFPSSACFRMALTQPLHDEGKRRGSAHWPNGTGHHRALPGIQIECLLYFSTVENCHLFQAVLGWTEWQCAAPKISADFVGLAAGTGQVT